MKSMHKTKNSLLEQAFASIPGFRKLYLEWEQQIKLNGYSSSTFYNYCRCIVKLSLHYKALPQELNQEQINHYLLYLKENEGKSLSFFKHTVFGLKNMSRLLAYQSDIKLPKVRRKRKLPVILSQRECKVLFKTPKTLKYRLLISLTYACGLRIREVARLRLSDIDFERKQIFIRESKYWKDRYVTLPDLISIGIKKYIQAYKPMEFLFEGKMRSRGMSIKWIQCIMRETVKESGIMKKVSMHNLRHTFATHAIENGQNLVMIQKELGHEQIQSTMLYLHIARMPSERKFVSPFDMLY